MLLGNASRGRIVAREIIEVPAGLRGLFVLRELARDGRKGLRFRRPAFWAVFAPARLDVIFLNDTGRVVAVVPRLPRWRGAGPYDGATQGVVLAEGTCDRIPVRPGDFLEFTPHTSERVAAGAAPPEHF